MSTKGKRHLQVSLPVKAKAQSFRSVAHTSTMRCLGQQAHLAHLEGRSAAKNLRPPEPDICVASTAGKEKPGPLVATPLVVHTTTPEVVAPAYEPLTDTIKRLDATHPRGGNRLLASPHYDTWMDEGHSRAAPPIGAYLSRLSDEHIEPHMGRGRLGQGGRPCTVSRARVAGHLLASTFGGSDSQRPAQYGAFRSRATQAVGNSSCRVATIAPVMASFKAPPHASPHQCSPWTAALPHARV